MKAALAEAKAAGVTHVALATCSSSMSGSTRLRLGEGCLSSVPDRLARPALERSYILRIRPPIACVSVFAVEPR